MADVLDRKHARSTDSDFVVAAARAIYCDWYLSDEKREARVSGPGVELTSVIPSTQLWAFERAREFAHSIALKFYQSDLPLNQAIDAITAQWFESWHGDRDKTEESAGWCAAMQAMGHGVGLHDYGVDVELPFLSSDR